MKKLALKSVLKELFEQDAEPAQPAEKGVVTSGDPQPGDAPPNKQLHVFDFDDTIGVTQDANGVMVYKDGVPLKTPQEMQQWLTSKGIGQNYMLKGPKGSSIEQPDGVEGVAAYINSAGLAKSREGLSPKQFMVAPSKPTPGAPDAAGEIVVADYSPSATAKAAVPIQSTLDKIKSLPSGVTSQIITARTGESTVANAPPGKDKTPKDFSGQAHPPSVESDLKAFMDKQGAKLTNGVKGLGGGNKGKAIKDIYFDGKPPEQQPDEVHFYDDDSRNIADVQSALAGQVPAEVFLYGPGEFAHGAANPDSPSKKVPAAPEQQTVKEYRLKKLIGLMREAKLKNNYVKYAVIKNLLIKEAKGFVDIRNVRKYSGRPSLKWLFEQAGPAPAAPAADSISTPWITPDVDQNLKTQGPNRAEKNGNPGNDINMLQGESPDKLWKIAMELLKYGRSATAPQVAIDNYGFGSWKGEADGAKWLTSIGGPEVLKSRIAKIAGGAAGLVPRAEMPVLLSKQSVEVKNPETGETVASGPQDQVAADLLAKGAIDITAPYAKAGEPATKPEEEKKLAENIMRSLNNPRVSSYIVKEYCKKNGYQYLSEQDDPFPTNLSANDKDSYLTKGLRDGNPTDDVNKIPANKGAQAPVSGLQPSQSDVYLSKALGFGFGKKYEGDPVIIAGNKVLDGHHRWAGANLGDPSFQMKGIQIGEPSAEGVAVALKALRSIGNSMGNAQKGGKEESLKESSWSVDRWQILAGIRKR